jgi:hypothetical protein
MKLKQLKVRPKKLLEASPCIVEMGAMLECWSRSGVDDPRCAQTAKALATCMSKPVSSLQHPNHDIVRYLAIINNMNYRPRRQNLPTQSTTIWLDWENNSK